jgi:hypothetical protein
MTRILIAVGLAIAALAVVAGCGGDAGGGESGEQPPFSTAEWSTDFGEHSVALEEFTGGGPPKDGIPAIDSPRFVSADQADDFLAPREPVAVLELRGAARAYPLQILVWHEIVNHPRPAHRGNGFTYCYPHRAYL